MLTRNDLQLLGEEYITKLLKKSRYIILGTNVRRFPFEFDIVCSKHSRQFVYEVRTTSRNIQDITQLFPPKKLYTLFKGISLHFYDAELICCAVYVHVGTITYKRVKGTDLL